jgi:hypothetical protein
LKDDEFWWVAGCVIGLSAIALLHAAALARLRRDVEFVTVLAEKRMTNSA